MGSSYAMHMKGRLLVAVQFGCLIALLILPSSGMASTSSALVSATAVVIGGVVLTAAFVNLRKSLSVFPEPLARAQLVTNGIYRAVRHPMYLGVLLIAGGVVITKWTWTTLLVFVILFIDLQIKYRYEDRLLAAKWPAASNYQQQVGALLPRMRSDKHG